jgi:hypothetical protein
VCVCVPSSHSAIIPRVDYMGAFFFVTAQRELEAWCVFVCVCVGCAAAHRENEKGGACVWGDAPEGLGVRPEKNQPAPIVCVCVRVCVPASGRSEKEKAASSSRVSRDAIHTHTHTHSHTTLPLTQAHRHTHLVTDARHA